MALLGVLVLSSCQTADPLSGDKDPKYEWWSLEFFSPLYMVGWVEASLVEDIQGRTFNKGSSGIVGTGIDNFETDFARGWPRGKSGGIDGVVGADLPKRVYVRWQSIVEPQTYRVWIDIPERARQLMHISTHRRCPKTPDRPALYLAALHLGLAPGGIVQVWTRDECNRPVKIARAQAEIEPLGPSQGKTDGRYAYKINEKTKQYIDKYGIPYGSW
nr:DUF2931 family protein [Stutzerimonas stutzeri]